MLSGCSVYEPNVRSCIKRSSAFLTEGSALPNSSTIIIHGLLRCIPSISLGNIVTHPFSPIVWKYGIARSPIPIEVQSRYNAVCSGKRVATFFSRAVLPCPIYPMIMGVSSVPNSTINVVADSSVWSYKVLVLLIIFLSFY